MYYAQLIAFVLLLGATTIARPDEPAESTAGSADEYKSLEGKWSKDVNANPEEHMVVATSYKEGRVDTCNMKIRLAHNIFIGKIELITRGKTRWIVLGDFAKLADLPRTIEYRLDGDTIILVISEGAAKGEHRLNRVKASK